MDSTAQPQNTWRDLVSQQCTGSPAPLLSQLIKISQRSLARSASFAQLYGIGQPKDPNWDLMEKLAEYCVMSAHSRGMSYPTAIRINWTQDKHVQPQVRAAINGMTLDGDFYTPVTITRMFLGGIRARFHEIDYRPDPALLGRDPEQLVHESHARKDLMA